MDTDKFLIVDYSDKAVAVPDEYSTALQDEFKLIGGRFNSRLKFGAGWIFSKVKHLENLKHLFAAYDLDFANVDLRDIVSDTNKDNDGKTTIKLLTNPEKQQAGINVNDMAMMLPGGEIVRICREKINTEFCFGYSDCGQGMTHEEASTMCDKARTDENYFISDNLDRLDWIIDKLQHPDKHGRSHAWIANYYTGGKNCWSIEFNNTPEDKPDWLGYDEKTMYNAGTLKPVTDEYRVQLVEFYNQARQVREKRCRTYLKRYGLTKLRCWTYWADA